ncbi:uncharacterized protein LOC62_02G002439 [Vanrija pseudolonga]|uniref:Methyltransferase type 11 domain-containing protein n=1 Tax=Vanrija pseudolonga TaxID=143232 RepID=A0AAF1BIM0_9TREE|nr:hypothetical protein LOC62_02G002439 [Vanrija pseudolonga]
MNLFLLFLAIPLLWRVATPFIPDEYLDPYAYWNTTSINRQRPDGFVPIEWRNLGYWDAPNATFTEANEKLARKLLEFARARQDGNTLDIAHGAGDSLLIHLESHPEQLHALTPLQGESDKARKKLFERAIWAKLGGTPIATNVKMHVAPATFKDGTNLEHPLNPMRHHVGQKADGDSTAQTDGEAEEPEPEIDDDKQAAFSAPDDDSTAGEPPASDPKAPFDLVYVLDSVYHFPPSVDYFAQLVYPALRKGSGVLAYTDALPPPSWSEFPMNIVSTFISPLLSVPPSNLSLRPKTLDEYKTRLESFGYTDVEVEDWSDHVWQGIADNFKPRGGAYGIAGRVFGYAGNSGWRYVAVRATRPGNAPAEEQAHEAQAGDA